MGSGDHKIPPYPSICGARCGARCPAQGHWLGAVGSPSRVGIWGPFGRETPGVVIPQRGTSIGLACGFQPQDCNSEAVIIISPGNQWDGGRAAHGNARGAWQLCATPSGSGSFQSQGCGGSRRCLRETAASTHPWDEIHRASSSPMLRSPWCITRSTTRPVPGVLSPP